MKHLMYLMLTFVLSFHLAFGQYETKGQAKTGSFVYEQAGEVVKVKPLKGKKVKNVILMIGDGMGLSQVSAAWIANRGQLNIDNFTYTGFSRTWCANRLITDSGAAGSAMATGRKTNYHHLAVDSLGNPLNSLTDLAHAAGLKTGIVVTCNLSDATPAAFCANNSDRDLEEAIAADYLNCRVDYIFGGGRDQFNNRRDKRDLMAEMQQQAYQVCTSWDETRQIKQGKVFSVPEEGQLPLARERGDLFSQACLHAIDILNRDKKGFFAMFEGSRIDDCGHWNDLPRLIEEVLDFDRTVGQVMKWAEKDKNTLVIVLADHETGGLSILGGDLETGSVTGTFSTDDHSGILVPVYAYGPGADSFTGIYENTEIFRKIVNLLNLKE
ncbi:alkaline phosphatase [Gaoshiqia sp. Z1-71]|uniref:alkaline phosphatase n=1 Tax=Gaoshiqia hydrogeniformans TaxID=3290090 RepID=UPI003BF8DD63